MKAKYAKFGNVEFLVTDTGRILRTGQWSFRVRGRTLYRVWLKSKKVTPSIGIGGQPHVNLGGTSQYVSRVVAGLFKPPSSPRHVLVHRNGDKLDNRVTNLMWVSKAEMIKHSKARLGFWRPVVSGAKKQAIIRFREAGHTQRDAATKYGVCQMTVAKLDWRRGL